MKRDRLIHLINYYHLWYLLYICFVVLLFILSFLPFMPSSFVHVPLLIAFIDIAWEAIEKLRQKKIGTELFLVIATIISLIGHQEQAMTIVLLIMLGAEYLETLITDRTTQAIKSLVDLIPRNAIIQVDGKEKTIPIDDVQPGMKILVKTGGKIPVDGTIIDGTAEVNEASLTGESASKEKAKPEKVFAGTFLESGALVIEAQKIGADTFFSKITALVEQAEEKKAKVTLLTDRVAFFLVPSLLLVFGIVWLITKDLNLVTTLLVFGSPLELTLITPLSILSGIIAAFRNGILVKGGFALEKLSTVDTIIFDKTGTLTMGEPRVEKIEALNSSATTQDIIKLAAIAEKRSGHVISKALLTKAYQEGIDVPDPDKYEYVSGHGVEITYQNQRCFLGNRHFIEAPEHGNMPIPTEEETEDTYSSFYLGCSGKLLGKIYIADQIRTDAKEIINELKKDIPTVALVSGDKQSIVSNVAKQLGIEKSYGGVFPDQKLLMIEDLERNGHRVAMVGDGINDAPALKQATVGIAMGAMGMEPAMAAADIVLTTNDLHKLVFVQKLSKKVFKVIKENLIFGFGAVHAIGMALAFLGFLTPIRAVLFHAVTDVAILINSTRLMNFSIKHEQK